MTTFNRLSDRMNEIAGNIRVNANNIKQAAAISILQDVTNGTPVDTGLARGNWRVEVGRGVPRTPTPHPDQTGGRTIQLGIATARTSEPEERINVFNNVPYIVALNGGIDGRGTPHSPQAEAGFIQTSIRRARQVIARRVRRILERT